MLRLKRETGDHSPQPHRGGKPPSLSPKHIALLRAKVRQQSDIPLFDQTSLGDLFLQGAVGDNFCCRSRFSIYFT
jgi:hypothetical protein